MRPSRSLVLLLAIVALPLGAQARVSRNTEVRAAPDGNVVADVRSGTSWQTGAARDGWTLLTLQGWVDASRFAGRADSFPESIGGSQNLRIREQPSLEGRILGELRPGAGLRVVERRGSWARFRRDAWVPSSAIGTATAAATRPVAAIPARGTPSPAATRDSSPEPNAPRSTDAVPAGSLRATVPTALSAAPTGAVIGRLEPGAVVEPIARDRGWVRVRLDAWVAESLLTPADTSFGATLTAADLRLDPVGNKGRVVRWDVEVVGLQRADVLRKDLAENEPYLLAMGPGSEKAILYLAIPPSLLEEARAISPLAKVLITARVRAGRSEPTGTPVLDLLSIVKR